MDGSIVWPNGWIGPEADAARIDPRPQLPRRPQRHRQVPGDSRRQDRHHGLQHSSAMTSTPTSSRRTTFEVSTPRKSTRTRRGRSAAGSWPTSRRSASPSRATCASRRRRWPRRSSKGAREQGADVVDYGMMGTDMLYFAVARDGHDGGVQITASHNPEGIQRHQDGAEGSLPAVGRGRHQRHPRHDRLEWQLPPPAATPGGAVAGRRGGRLRQARAVVHRHLDHQAVQRRPRRRQRHGRPGRAAALQAHSRRKS